MSEVDAEHLLELAHRKSAEARTVLAQTVSDLFCGGGGSLTDRERSLMFDILRKIITDVEVRVRKALSEKLADLPEAPHDLIRSLANDTAEVAYPVLTRSRVLADRDLIEVIRNRTLEHQLAIALRFSVSEAVSEVLAETGEESVIETLLGNPNARISQSTLSYLVEQSRRVDRFREPLLRREELSPELAKRMFLWVSAALREHIIARYDLDEVVVDRLVQEAALEQLEEADDEEGEGTAEEIANELAGDLAEQFELDPEMLVQALAQGEVALFVGMFAGATGLRSGLIKRLLFEPGGEGLAIACKALGLDRDTFSRLFALSRAARPQHASAERAAAHRVLAFFERIPAKEARRVMERWKLDPEYTAAIRALQEGISAYG